MKQWTCVWVTQSTHHAFEDIIAVRGFWGFQVMIHSSKVTIQHNTTEMKKLLSMWSVRECFGLTWWLQDGVSCLLWLSFWRNRSYKLPVFCYTLHQVRIESNFMCVWFSIKKKIIRKCWMETEEGPTHWREGSKYLQFACWQSHLIRDGKQLRLQPTRVEFSWRISIMKTQWYRKSLKVPELIFGEACDLLPQRSSFFFQLH